MRSVHSALKMLMPLFFLSLVFPCLLSAQSGEKDIINWGVRHFPPLYILEGEYKNQGIVDQMLELIFKNLPEYEHEKIVSNNKRAEEEIRKGGNFAKLAMLKKPEREEYMYYSLPHYISPSHRLIIRRDSLPKIKGIVSGNNELSLEELLKVPNIRIGVELGRSVGKELDDILKKYENQKNITVISSPNTEKTIQMLAKGNIECIIEYPAVVTFILKKEPEKMKLLSTLQITEKDPYVIAYAVAPKNEWGHNLIQKINEVLKKEVPTEAYRNYIEQWLDESSIEPFRIEYQKRLVDVVQQ